MSRNLCRKEVAQPKSDVKKTSFGRRRDIAMASGLG